MGGRATFAVNIHRALGNKVKIGSIPRLTNLIQRRVYIIYISEDYVLPVCFVQIVGSLIRFDKVNILYSIMTLRQS